MSYSLDFCKKVLAYCEKTGSIPESICYFSNFAQHYLSVVKINRETGELYHQVKGTKPRKVDRNKLLNYLENHRDAYLTEIASEFDCHSTTIYYALKAMGYTRKKSCVYFEQDPKKVNLFLKEFNNLSHLTPVYIDETGFETFFHREYARSLKAS